MINYVMIGTNRYEQAVSFYDALLSAMGATRVGGTERYVGWGWGIGTPMFILTRPYDQRPATVGNGSMVAFDVETPELVDSLHAKVLALPGRQQVQFHLLPAEDTDRLNTAVGLAVLGPAVLESRGGTARLVFDPRASAARKRHTTRRRWSFK
jgi:hypothetical protein